MIATNAQVLTRPTESCTHIIYKGGKQSTAVFYRRLPEDKRPFVVGIRWVVRSKETGRRAPEDEHVVNLDEEDIFQIVSWHRVAPPLTTAEAQIDAAQVSRGRAALRSWPVGENELERPRAVGDTAPQPAVCA